MFNTKYCYSWNFRVVAKVMLSPSLFLKDILISNINVKNDQKYQCARFKGCVEVAWISHESLREF